MAIKKFPISNDFTAGEVSERFEGRTDVGKYYSALKRLINFLPFTQGGVTRRPALRFGRNNFCDLQGRIIPFKFTRDVDSNFIVHLCDERLFITDDVGSEIPPPPEFFMECEVVLDSGVFTPCEATSAFDCGFGSPHSNYKAVGGTPPYSWMVTTNNAPPILTITGVNNEFLTVDVPVNPGFAIPGKAYKTEGCGWFSLPCSACFACQSNWDCYRAEYKCDGTPFQPSGVYISCCGCGPNCEDTDPIPPEPIVGGCNYQQRGGKCEGCDAHCTFFIQVDPLPCIVAPPPNASGIIKVAVDAGFGLTTDLRSPGMIAGQCFPCNIEMNQIIVTVTDTSALMTSVTIDPFGP